jgi:hypothetical protein
MDVRPPENEQPLRPGDILLFHGHGFVSWAIRRFDESDVDRVAIVLRPETMAEATASGLRHVAIQPAVDGNAFTYVRRLTAGAAPMSVVEQALSFATDLPPTNDRTVLLAVLAMTRKLPIGEPTLNRLLCVSLDRATGIVDRSRVRGRSLLFGSDFVYRCFERVDDPLAAIEVRPVSPPGQGPSSVPSAGAMKKAEATLWEWASQMPDPKVRIAKRPREPLEPLIAAFARVDSPNDPIVPRTYVADAGVAEPARPVDDAQLLAASVRFRDAILRLEAGPDPSTDRDAGDRWRRFLTIASVVTPGDLRYSHSLQTVTSLRPSVRSSRMPVRRERAPHDAER